MQLVAAREIRRRLPEAQIAIHVSYPEDDAPLYEEYETVLCSRRKPARALTAILKAALYRITRIPFLLTPELRSYRDADFVVDLSGDGLTETFGWRCPVSHAVPMLLARILGRPFCLMGQTIGPFRRVGGWVRWIANRAVFVTARDQETMDYLARWKLKTLVEPVADLAFLLEPAPREESIERLRSLGDYDPDRPLIGITPSNLHNVRTVEAGGSQPHLKLIADGVGPLLNEINAQALIIPHVFGPGEAYDDRIAARQLGKLMELQANVLVVKDALPPGDLKGLIGCCDVFAGMRMHSVIAAVSQAVPTIALAYSAKHHGLMSRLGLAQYALDLNNADADTLGKTVAGLWNERDSIRHMLKRVIADKTLPESTRNFEILFDHFR